MGDRCVRRLLVASLHYVGGRWSWRSAATDTLCTSCGRQKSKNAHDLWVPSQSRTYWPIVSLEL